MLRGRRHVRRELPHRQAAPLAQRVLRHLGQSLDERRLRDHPLRALDLQPAPREQLEARQIPGIEAVAHPGQRQHVAVDTVVQREAALRLNTRLAHLVRV
eukprot:6703881-Pyramimonas_sp.AAC.1